MFCYRHCFLAMVLFLGVALGLKAEETLEDYEASLKDLTKSTRELKAKEQTLAKEEGVLAEQTEAFKNAYPGLADSTGGLLPVRIEPFTVEKLSKEEKKKMAEKIKKEFEQYRNNLQKMDANKQKRVMIGKRIKQNQKYAAHRRDGIAAFKSGTKKERRKGNRKPKNFKKIRKLFRRAEMGELRFDLLLLNLSDLEKSNKIGQMEIEAMKRDVYQAIHNSLLGEYLREREEKREAELMQKVCDQVPLCAKAESGAVNNSWRGVKEVDNVIGPENPSLKGGGTLDN